MEATVLANFQKIPKTLTKLWSASKYFRVISLITGSITFTLAMRNLYIRIYRKYYNMPNGPIGFPLIGQSLDIMKHDFLVQIATNYGCIASFMMGPYNGILINEPNLARKYYSDPRSLNTLAMSKEFADSMFIFANGKTWSDRRRIIYSNLMSTMKAEFIEKSIKKFIKTKICPVFDENITNNKSTILKPLFRALAFNVVCQACFGKELSSLNDPIWVKWNNQITEYAKNGEIYDTIFVIFGESKFTEYLSRFLVGGDVKNEFKKLTDILDDFSQNKAKDIVRDKNDDNIKLFNDYIENINESKWTRRQLLGDMTMMFFAATDTTYASLAFSCLLAAKYPHIQQEIHEELINAFGTNMDNMELRHKGISKIPKLRAFIQESLRICPPLPIAGFRQMLDEGMTINTSNGKTYSIPKNTMTMINVAAISQNAKYWIKNYDPISNTKHKNINMNEINFDFWIDDDGHFTKKKNSSSFFTFHYGKRDCPGQALAMKELMIVLAMIFMKYKVVSSDGKTDFKIDTVFDGVVNEPSIKDIRFEKYK